MEPRLRHVSDCLLVIQHKFNAIEKNERMGVGLKFREQLEFDPWIIRTTLQNLCRQAERICSRSSPVMGMPADILFILFDTLREEWPGSREDSHTTWQKAVLHTCRSWRETAMRHARLWTDISLNVHQSRSKKDSKARFALRRSGKAPLQLRIEGETNGTYLSSLGKQFLQNVIPRAADLHLTGHLGGKALDILSSVRCPRLCTLTVGAMFCRQLQGGAHRMDEDGPDPSEMRVLPKLFQGRFPNLLSLSIGVLHNYDTGNAFKNLKQLRLYWQRYCGPVAINSLLDLLKSVPTLEDLEFEGVEVEVRALPEVDHRVVLPSLQRLVFSDVSLAGCRYLMSLLECPNKELALTCICNQSGVDEEGRVSINHIMNKAALSAGFPTLTDFFQAKITISDSKYCISAVNSYSGIHVNVTENTISLEYDDRFRRWNFAHDDALHFLSSVEELWLQAEDGLRTEWQGILRRILESAPQVRKLVLKFSDPLVYCETFKVLDEVLPARVRCDVCIVGLWDVDRISTFDSELSSLSETSTVSVHIYGEPNEAQREHWRGPMNSWASHGVEMVANAHPFHVKQLPRVCREETKGIWNWTTFGGRDWVNC